MVSEAVGHDFHQHRLVLGQAEPPSLGGGGIDRQSIVAVNPYPVHAIPRGTRDDAVPTVLVLNRGAARKVKISTQLGVNSHVAAVQGRQACCSLNSFGSTTITDGRNQRRGTDPSFGMKIESVRRNGNLVQSTSRMVKSTTSANPNPNPNPNPKGATRKNGRPVARSARHFSEARTKVR